jgi:hypothetical protein
MAHVNKRTPTETKYVTLLADARPDVDITFRDAVLTRPTDHYLVGVDNFTLCSSGFSMIEPRLDRNHTDLIRIVRKPAEMVAGLHNATAELPRGVRTIERLIFDHGATITGFLDAGINARIDSTVIITSVQQLLERLNRMADIVNTAMHIGIAQQTLQGHILRGYAPVANEETAHLKFRVSRDGRLIIEGTNAFWTIFAIEVPSLQNQYGFYGPELGTVNPFYSQTGRRYLTMDSHTGQISFGNMVAIRTRPYTPPADANEINHNSVALSEATARVLTVENFHHDGGLVELQTHIMNITDYTNGVNLQSGFKRTVFLDGNILSALDRRVALELGTSLPVKNSPMVDHQKETPDFVLARWILKPQLLLITNDQGQVPTHSTAISTTVEHQGASDRITYHELMPQQKLQVLRVKLYARIRRFDEATESWSMRVIELPTTSTDWWHVRIHFVSKD